MEKENKRFNIYWLFWIFTILFFIGGGFLFVFFSKEGYEHNNLFVGLFLLLDAVPCLLSFTRKNVRALFSKIFVLIIGVIMAITASISIIFKEIDLNIILIIWGITDIVHGAYEILEALLDIKHKEYEGLFNLPSALVEGIFGVLLLIHLMHGIKVHFIAIGINYIYTVLKLLIIFVFIKRIKREE